MPEQGCRRSQLLSREGKLVLTTGSALRLSRRVRAREQAVCGRRAWKGLSRRATSRCASHMLAPRRISNLVGCSHRNVEPLHPEARKWCAMIHLATSDLLRFLASYGYWAVLLFVAIESTGIPFPGETILLIAAIFAGTTHRLFIPLVILAAASGAILGDNVGFWVGREGGFRLLRRYGRYIRLDERKLKLGLYLFRRHGGKVVFFGRFIAVLRAWAAFLAGTNRMRWPAFLLFNALGGIVWATVYGLGGYFLGENIHRLAGPIGTISIVLAALIIIASLIFVWRNERQLEEKAEKALPGPLENY